MRIVFYGTPDFAVASLDAIIKAGFNVVGIVTSVDKPSGRGLKLQYSDVKQYALETNIPILQPTNMKSPEFHAALDALQPDIQVVVAFRMMPEVVWNRYPLGTINVHGSLLPQYRGAAPINWVLINGETETGVSTFKLKHDIDTGDILKQLAITIEPNDDFGSLYNKLKIAGGQILVETLKGIQDNSIQPQAQSHINPTTLKQAPKLTKELGLIDWNKDVMQLHNLVRGLSPIPTAYTLLDNKKLKIYQSAVEWSNDDSPIGSYKTDQKTYLKYRAKAGYLHLKNIQLEGKKRMDISAFLLGYRFSETK